ncbi:UNVERIFIED_ORG: hypothetical protein ABIC43_004699 [Variovorax guangxiensis]
MSAVHGALERTDRTRGRRSSARRQIIRRRSHRDFRKRRRGPAITACRGRPITRRTNTIPTGIESITLAHPESVTNALQTHLPAHRIRNLHHTANTAYRLLADLAGQRARLCSVTTVIAPDTGRLPSPRHTVIRRRQTGRMSRILNVRRSALTCAIHQRTVGRTRLRSCPKSRVRATDSRTTAKRHDPLARVLNIRGLCGRRRPQTIRRRSPCNTCSIRRVIKHRLTLRLRPPLVHRRH